MPARSDCSSGSTRTPTRRPSTFWSSNGSSARNTRIRSPTTTFSPFPPAAAPQPRVSRQAAAGHPVEARRRRRPGQARRLDKPASPAPVTMTAGIGSSGPHRQRDRRRTAQSRHRRRRLQEQGRIDQDLQRTPEIQRVGVCLRSNTPRPSVVVLVIRLRAIPRRPRFAVSRRTRRSNRSGRSRCTHEPRRPRTIRPAGPTAFRSTRSITVRASRSVAFRKATSQPAAVRPAIWKSWAETPAASAR